MESASAQSVEAFALSRVSASQPNTIITAGRSILRPGGESAKLGAPTRLGLSLTKPSS
jgi:hypothetical protein